MNKSGLGFAEAKYQNVNCRLAGVVFNGRATLYELKHVYSYEDVFWLEEVDYIPEVNKQRFIERQKRHAEMKRLAK